MQEQRGGGGGEGQRMGQGNTSLYKANRASSVLSAFLRPVLLLLLLRALTGGLGSPLGTHGNAVSPALARSSRNLSNSVEVGRQ